MATPTMTFQLEAGVADSAVGYLTLVASTDGPAVGIATATGQAVAGTRKDTARPVRTVTDGVTDETTTVASATAEFVASDVGRPITGTGIPASTRIVSVTSSTAAVLSAATTATATGVTFTLGAQALLVFPDLNPNSGSSDDVIDDPTGTVWRLVVKANSESETAAPVFFTAPDLAGSYDIASYTTTEPGALPGPGAGNTTLGTDLTGTVSDAVIRAALKAELTNQTDLLTRWNAGLAVIGTERVDALFPNDSMTQPWSAGSGGAILSWLELLTEQFRVFGAVTSDWRPAGRTFGATWTTTGAYSAAITHGFGAAGVTLDPGEYWEDTFGGEASNPGDAVAVYVTLQASGGASAQVLIDGGEVKAATTTTGAATQMHKFYESSLQDGAEHTVRVVASGTGTVKLDGILVHHGTLSAGLVLWNGSLSGSTIQDHLDAGGFEDHATQLIADDTLALVVFASGLASYGYPGTATGLEWETETQAAIDMLDGLGSYASTLIVCEYEPAGGFQTLNTNWQGWATTMPPLMRTLAETNGCAFRSLPGVLPTVAGTALASNGVDYWSWGTTIDGETYDYTHTNARGQRQIADAIWPVLSQVSTHAQLATIADVSSGAGDVVGPASATDSRLVTFDGTTGKLVQSEATVATDQIVETTGGRVQVGDGTAGHGLAAMVSSVFGPGLSVANDTADTQPAAYLGGTAAGLRLGPGGSTAADVTIVRTGTAAATVTGALTAASGSATTSLAGLVELATTAEVQAGTDTARAVTAAGTAAAISGTSPWLVDLGQLAPGKQVSSVGSWTSSFSASLHGGGYYRNVGGTTADEIIWKVALGAGTWELNTYYTRFTDAAILTVSLGGSTVGTVDTYGTLANNVLSTFSGIAVSVPGVFNLRYQTLTKNASSSGYGAYLQTIFLRRTA